AGHIFRAVSCMNQVLFAINDTYCINEKKAVRMIETFEHRPEGYTQKVNRIFEELGVSPNKCCDRAESLYDEVKQILSAMDDSQTGGTV
ncbi:MAG TPA: nucleotidyltransferase domain-containing protein, partial [Clostridia bacterium]